MVGHNTRAKEKKDKLNGRTQYKVFLFSALYCVLPFSLSFFSLAPCIVSYYLKYKGKREKGQTKW
jgi:hypothetical protein